MGVHLLLVNSFPIQACIGSPFRRYLWLLSIHRWSTSLCLYQRIMCLSVLNQARPSSCTKQHQERVQSRLQTSSSMIPARNHPISSLAKTVKLSNASILLTARARIVALKLGMIHTGLHCYRSLAISIVAQYQLNIATRLHRMILP